MPVGERIKAAWIDSYVLTLFLVTHPKPPSLDWPYVGLSVYSKSKRVLRCGVYHICSILSPSMRAVQSCSIDMETANEVLSMVDVRKGDDGDTKKKTDLLAFTLPQLQQWLGERDEPAFRAKQIFGWLYRHLVTDFAAMTNLPASLRQRLAEEACIGPMIVRSELHSKDDRTRKVLLELADGKLVESVLMLYPPLGENSSRATVCVSSQAGCAFGCTFCATV